MHTFHIRRRGRRLRASAQDPSKKPSPYKVSSFVDPLRRPYPYPAELEHQTKQQETTHSTRPPAARSFAAADAFAFI